ncbi:MAG: pyruvate:ferredoxin (flavodoxin) oxidoreductase [Neisseriaceae bacterium]|nr:MAG: pyruvate:ferredoxin (flavodoxin) oxidoreductase [Neisseriaceae bacterium]
MKQLQVMDGNAAAAYIAHATNEVIAIYPITPSSTIGEIADEKSANGETNIWGQIPSVTELQSEAGAVATVHGALAAGSLSTTFTASQGLLLMLPNMHKIAGELTPTVFYVTARTIASHALSIFCDHSDVMAARNTGFAILFASSVQEVMDLALLAQNATLESRIPFMLAFDGFRTSHELNKIEVIDRATIKSFINQEALLAHRSRRLTPDKPHILGTAQNPDVFFQGREAGNRYYQEAQGIIKNNLQRLAEITGRNYLPFEYYGAEDATRVIIAMGSACETINETIATLNQHGEKVGAIKVRLYRPFYAEDFISQLPASTQAIAVLDRSKESGSLGEPLYLDIKTAVVEAWETGQTSFKQLPNIIGGRYGLSSKEFTPAMVKAVFDNLSLSKTQQKRKFVVGINDDVTNLSLNYGTNFTSECLDNFRGKFYGIGSDGTVSANKNSIKIIGEHSDLAVQGFFEYDSKKSGSYTISHLRFGKQAIQSSYLIQKANFIACHNFSFVFKYDILADAEEGATLLLASSFNANELWVQLPQQLQAQLITKKIRLLNVQAHKIAAQHQLGKRINTIMQCAFFALSKVLPLKIAINAIKESIQKTYARKGSDVVAQNIAAVDSALAAIEEVNIPEQVTSTISMSNPISADASPFVQKIVAPMLKLQGNQLPVSSLPDDGAWPSATSKYEKRNIAAKIPEWNQSLCTQCGLCTLVCPHAAIRSKVFAEDELTTAPHSFKHQKAKIKGFQDKQYALQVAPEDCTGCDACYNICPVLEKNTAGEFNGRKALNMIAPASVMAAERENFAFFTRLSETHAAEVAGGINNLKGSQLMQPLFEFSGACSGCGETPYIKLLTQLIGDRLMIANATGCSSIFGGNLPTTPYCTNDQGRGPAWANSLFEDNAEFALGMRLAQDQLQEKARIMLLNLINSRQLVTANELILAILNATPQSAQEIDEQRQRIIKLKAQLQTQNISESKQLLEIIDHILDKSIWALGGDGWAYDIGYGGLDHVIASGKKVKFLILDTESYSNTGGQMSKATPLGAIAKFASTGKNMFKKDLGMLAMSYRNVYVAQIALEANPMQAIRALSEAESYDGPAIVIAYAQCIAHGIDMTHGAEQQRRAVHSGYWLLYRFNPALNSQNKQPLQLDSKAPILPLSEYFSSENRFRSVSNLDTKLASEFLEQAQENVMQRFERYQYLANMPSNTTI